MEYLLIALLLFFIWRTSSRSKNLQVRLDRLEAAFKNLRDELAVGKSSDSIATPDSGAAVQQSAIHQTRGLEDSAIPSPQLKEQTATAQSSSEKASSQKPRQQRSKFADSLQQNWMLWLGGFCVALAEIFLAKYSVEQGLLGPSARITLGVLTGLALHGSAEWFRRKTGESNPSFAALAGGGSIALFAILLAALHFYQMISPAWAFALLAVIALETMVLSLIHGPALAAIGLLGAYTVPIFVSDGSGAILFALAYALVITASGLLLLRYVYRNWLWLGILLGAFLWWAISLTYSDILLEQAWYLAAVAYCFIAIPPFNWLLSQPYSLPHTTASTLLFNIDGRKKKESTEAQEWRLRIGAYVIIAAQCALLLTQVHLPIAVYAWTPLLAILLITARYRESFTVLPWILVIGQILVIALAQVHEIDGQFELIKLGGAQATQLAWFAGISSLVIVVLGWLNLKGTRFKGIWSAFITLAPLLLLTLCYFVSADILSTTQWLVITASLAALYLFVASIEQKRNQSGALLVWLIFAGHFAASLAAVVVMQEGHLTLALALQIVSIAWIIQHFKLPQLGWLLKLVVAVVVIRLTLNPWVVSYSNETHWSLLTYGGATLCSVLAARLLKSISALEKWAEGAALHLFVLFLWSELRYWLNDGNIFAESLTSLEASLSMVLFGALSIVYYRRSLVSETLKRIYTLFSYGLIRLSLVYYALILTATLAQGDWIWTNIASTPIVNLMLLSFGAPVLLGWLVSQYHAPSLKTKAFMFSGVAAFIFINLQIKHLWQGDIRLYEPMQSGELYTYSIVWLAIAVALVLGGALRSSKSNQTIYRVGIGLLGLVIAKLFLVDMSDLDGLLRVASFMGLGLSLLGLSYLHQRIQRSRGEEDALQE